MTTKKTPTDDGGKVRAAMAVPAKRTINDLLAAYTKTTGKPANRLGKDALVKPLVATVAAEQPAPRHPTLAEQAEAMAIDKRRTGPRDSESLDSIASPPHGRGKALPGASPLSMQANAASRAGDVASRPRTVC